MTAFSGPTYCGLRVENPSSPSWRTYISHAASPLISAPIAGQPAACCIQTSENWVRRIFARRTRSSSGSVTSYRTLLIFSSMNFAPRMAAELDEIFAHQSSCLKKKRDGHQPPRFFFVCRACPTAGRCKSSSQPDGGEVIAKRKGLTARGGLKEAWSKDASRWTRTGFEAYGAGRASI